MIHIIDILVYVTVSQKKRGIMARFHLIGFFVQMAYQPL